MSEKSCAAPAEIAKKKQTAEINLFYKPVLNILNTFQYKQCSCFLKCMKC